MSATAVAEIIRKLGISEQTFERWKKRFAGLGVTELPASGFLGEATCGVRPPLVRASAVAHVNRGDDR